MLTVLAISNYRSLRKLIVPMRGLSVITGANGRGKSSLYRALRLLADERIRPAIDRGLEHHLVIRVAGLRPPLKMNFDRLEAKM
jgi:predicted ATPase